jgi:hypothetical protein
MNVKQLIYKDLRAFNDKGAAQLSLNMKGGAVC